MLTADDIRQWLIKEIRFDASKLADDAPLFSNGTLDSFTMVELVAFLEEKTGRVMPTIEVAPENVDTIARLVAWARGEGVVPQVEGVSPKVPADGPK
ncbi:MAG TPA: acyl carrier protein [Byssovorax sp.]|jgi:acyl carrier protein